MHSLDMLYFERKHSWSFYIGFVLWAKLLNLSTQSHIYSKMGLDKQIILFRLLNGDSNWTM